MKHGRVVEHGTYRELLARGIDFHAELADAHPVEPDEPSTPKAPDGLSVSPAKTPADNSAAAGSSKSSGGGVSVQSPVKLSDTPQPAGTKAAAPASTLQKGDLIKVRLRSHVC